MKEKNVILNYKLTNTEEKILLITKEKQYVEKSNLSTYLDIIAPTICTAIKSLLTKKLLIIKNENIYLSLSGIKLTNYINFRNTTIYNFCKKNNINLDEINTNSKVYSPKTIISLYNLIQ